MARDDDFVQWEIGEIDRDLREARIKLNDPQLPTVYHDHLKKIIHEFEAEREKLLRVLHIRQ
jgi:hypothetical protein